MNHMIFKTLKEQDLLEEKFMLVFLHYVAQVKNKQILKLNKSEESKIKKPRKEKK